VSPKSLIWPQLSICRGRANSDHARKQFGIPHILIWPLIGRKRAFLVGGFRSPTNPALNFSWNRKSLNSIKFNLARLRLKTEVASVRMRIWGTTPEQPPPMIVCVR
jgi:hypothetical protein